MRFTWGHAAVVIPVTIAVVFTGVLIKAISLKGRAELVVDNYYAKEIAYQENIDHTDNGKQINLTVNLITSPAVGFVLSADKEIAPVNGTVYMFRPSNKHLDFSMPLQLDSNNAMQLPNDKIVTGRYQLQVQFESEGTPYYIEHNVFIP